MHVDHVQYYVVQTRNYLINIKQKKFLFLQDSCPDNFASEGAADMQLSLTAATVTRSRTVSLQFPHCALFQEKKSGDVKLKRRRAWPQGTES